MSRFSSEGFAYLELVPSAGGRDISRFRFYPCSCTCSEIWFWIGGGDGDCLLFDAGKFGFFYCLENRNQRMS